MSKIKMLGLLLIAFFQMQCSSAQNNTNIKNQEGHYSVNKHIDWSKTNGNYYVSIDKGENTVFELANISGGDPRNDTQIKASIVFSIADSLNTISIENFENEPIFFIRQCRCIDAGYNKVISGSITGKSTQNGQWLVEIDIEAVGNDSGETYHFKYSGSVSKK